MTLHPSMMLALRAVRDGGHATKTEQFWLMKAQFINADGTLTMKGHNELNNDDKRKEDKQK